MEKVLLIGLHRHRVMLKAPFDLNATVDSWVFPDIQPMPEWKVYGQFARCLLMEGGVVPFRVLQQHYGCEPELIVEWSADWSGDSKEFVTRIGWLLGWDVETVSVLAVIQADPVISHIAEPLMGLRPYSQPTLFEALVKAILQQQVSYRSACQITRNLVVAYGPRCRLGELELWGFPLPEQLAKLSEAELRRCKVGYKASYLLELAERVVSGDLDLKALESKEPQVVLRELEELRGVGLWTAELTVLSGLRSLDIFPYDDLGIRNLISRLYLKGQSIRRKDVISVAERWGKYAPRVLYFLQAADVLNLV